MGEFARFGQSIWYDYLRRSLITSGELKRLIDEGLRGVTSNPSIFEKAIVGSTDYDESLRKLITAGKSGEEIYETLMLEDIASAADLLLPVYWSMDRADGYVSIEVSAFLANDTEGMVAEAKRFFKTLSRPNVMIKIPATGAGFSTIERLIGEGINVNVTLIFSLAQYKAAVDAYLAGLEKLGSNGGDLSIVSSVASFFLSRIDTAVDWELDKIGEKGLEGKIAVANAKMAYAEFRRLFASKRWRELESKGARVQRVLWASTSTKNPAYPDTLYVDNVIGQNTINTVTPETLRAILDHGKVANTVESGIDDAKAEIARLSDLGISLDTITRKLEDEGVAAFSKATETLLNGIAQKRDRLLSEWKHESGALHLYQAAVHDALSVMAENHITQRIWSHDHTVWKPEPNEITNRLGWLHSAEMMLENIHRIQDLVDEAQSAGYTQAFLLGMGGSSLAPKVLMKTFGTKPGFLSLSVIDSTDPAFLLNELKKLDPRRSLFIVSTKSGTTLETLSFFKFFYNRVREVVGSAKAGEHFAAITEPGTELVEVARRYRFRKTFLNDPTVGGRYSALSYFGLVPAGLMGVDIPILLHHALTAAISCESSVTERDNTGAWLGAVLGELAKRGRDKMTLVASSPVASFAEWVEQLVAESTGKEGKGILPVVGEPLGTPEVYGADRLFVHLQLEDDATYEAKLSALEEAGHPVIRLRLHDRYELGRQFFLWEMAIAVAAQLIGINPFDQPNVEMTKTLARQMISDGTVRGTLPYEKPLLEDEYVSIYGSLVAVTPSKALEVFLSLGKPGAYVGLQAYVEPTPETDSALLALRVKLRDKFKFATTVGYGPSFLHSTGQLHKGDAGSGLFIQFTTNHLQDARIPDEAGSAASSVTFQTVEMAQADADRQALSSRGRSVMRIHFKKDMIRRLNLLTEAIK
jgi:transaldolase/glucose-6-phosphate isomerase